MPVDAVLAGLIMIVGFSVSHSDIEVMGIYWVEPVFVWVAVCMLTGSGKSTLCKFLRNLVKKARCQCGEICDNQSFEKLGELIEGNHGKLVGLYDELSTFLAQVIFFFFFFFFFFAA